MSIKPENKFRKGTIACILVGKDWSGFTIPEIAEKLFTDPDTVRTTIYYVKRRSGYIVPYKKRQKRNAVDYPDREAQIWRMCSRGGCGS